MKEKKTSIKEKEVFYEAHKLGFDNGVKSTVNAVLRFIDEESRFTVDIHSDSLLDRLVSFLKKL